MNVADVLDRAADAIDARGHGKRTYVNDDGQVCAMGAMAVALGARNMSEIFIEVTTNPFVHRATDALDRILGVGIASWNDTHTAAEVTSTLRACAAVERARAAVAETVAA